MNLLFLLKYCVIYNFLPGVLIPAYFLLTAGIILYTGNTYSNLIIFNKKFVISGSILFSVAVLIYILIFDRIGEIGRQPAIEDWIARVLNGDFPYNSPHTPSSYPVIFLFAYPFYLIGNTGLLEFMGIVIFFMILFKQKDTTRGILVKILMFVTSIVIYYEIVTRSELFFNMMLIAGVVYFCEKFLKENKINSLFILSAIFTGCILCTRSVTALLFTIYFLSRFRFHFKHLIVFTAISVAVFIAFLLPFYLWDRISFIQNGPFAVQTYSSNLPLLFILLLFFAAIYSGWIISYLQEFFFSGGVILFFAAAVSFLFRVSETGFTEALFNDGYDIAYFIFCVPMLLLAIKDYKVDMYLGKLKEKDVIS
ncbi:MAG: hypothetical protein EHM47_13995 [Ignavibacteriales bacterium]|nr:MAG: hypothetical protein EHM47_13995 [Ignavibacteriales bacterium]